MEKLEILKFLIMNKETKYSIRSISKIRDVNYKSAYLALHELEREGCVDIEKIGNTKLVRFNFNFTESVFLVEYEKREELIKKKDFKVIYESLAKLPFSYIVLLFGSYAKKTQSKGSDIDLMTIGGEEKEILSKIRLFPLNIHHTNLTETEFNIMARSKDFTVVSESMKNNIILIGIEEYYRLINNVG
ncbi:MAG: nucleotidyltransferase domain-containing protein [Nanoarchaeota archaeon]|nr:nucleotidyltransferase domain-containing protein [Nanoarchaeota archaeon]